MFRKSILKCVTAALLLGSVTTYAKDRTHIETFIFHVKENNKLATVNDIWAVDNNIDRTQLDKAIKDAQPLKMDYAKLAAFLQKKSFAISLTLPAADGSTFTLELAQHQVLANDFEVFKMDANNVPTKFDYTPGLYYRGVVKGVEGSIAAFSFFDNQVYAFFSIPGVGNYVVVPNTELGSEFNNEHYILYNDVNILDKTNMPKCFTQDWESEHTTASKTTTTPNNKVYGSPQCKQVRWLHVVDNYMYQRKGATNATNYVTALMNGDGALYMNEGLAVVSKKILLNAAPDAYQSLPTAANSTGQWLSKFGQTFKDSVSTVWGCDLAQLLTSKGTQMGGVAWLNVLCEGYGGAPQHVGPYSFCKVDNTTSASVSPSYPTYSWDISATTHEMGHNLGSQHTHACAWGATRTQAIDGCYTPLEGSCSNPGIPTATEKGTIMSYCHLVYSPVYIGINFANGFGLQPGDTVRYQVSNSSSFCGEIYKPNVALAKANRTITADRECTDPASGITYYWKSGNNIQNADDTLLLMIKKNGNNIGNLNTTGFSVTTTTLTGYGGGTAQSLAFPAGVPGVASSGNNYAARRYWKVAHTGAATFTTPVDVAFPLTPADTTDVNGSVPGPTAPFSNFRLYSVKNATLDPNPSVGFSATTAANINVYNKSSSASTNHWTTMVSGSTSTMLAYFKTNTLYGGGAFYSYGVNGVSNLNGNAGIEIFPNPTSSEWYVSLSADFDKDAVFHLYSADGRISKTMQLQAGAVTGVNAADLPAGMYFYRIISGGNVYTGNLVKN